MSGYRYETHLHVKGPSKCGHSTGAELARYLKEEGYQGFVVTDHFFNGNSGVPRDLPWEERIELFCKGYEEAKEEGDRIGIDVFFGVEWQFHNDEYLLYGPDKEWLLRHPEIKDASIEEQYRLVHEAGGIVIHAHPFREASYIPEIRLFPEFVDGVETVNATHVWTSRQPDGTVPYDEKAKDYAKKHDFVQTAGSDIHSVHLIGGGMAFQKKLENVQEFIKEVMTGSGILLP